VDVQRKKVSDALSRVIVVEHDFHDFVLSKDKGVCVATVDYGVCGVGAGGEDCV
jgi:hypothetical protein